MSGTWRKIIFNLDYFYLLFLLSYFMPICLYFGTYETQERKLIKSSDAKIFEILLGTKNSINFELLFSENLDEN